MKPKFIFPIALLVFLTNVFAQPTNSNKPSSGIEVENYITQESSRSQIYFKSDSKIKTEDFFTAFSPYLEITKDDKFVFVKESTSIGLNHRWYQQYHNGVMVVGGEYMLHSRNGFIETANGNAISYITISTSPTLSPQFAVSALQKIITLPLGKDDTAFINRWISDLDKTEEKLQLSPELILMYDNYVIQPQASDYKLCYKFNVVYTEMISSEYIYIDANTGEVFKREPMAVNCTLGSGQTSWNGVKNINTTFSGAAYILDEQCLNSHGNVHTKQYSSWGTGSEYADVDNNWNNPSAVTAHWYGRQSLDYYYNYFGRNSYDNSGSGFVILNEANGVANGTTLDNNAFFDSNSNIMYLGRGNNTSSPYDDLNTLDIIGHELTHGVTAYSAGLNYQNESGALNESFSDILGTAIERHVYGPNSFDWTIGEDLSTGVIRSLQSPKNYGKHFNSNTCTACNGGCATSLGQPNTYYGTNWYTGVCDNGGVHINSGVQNFWFYLLVNGGTGTNDNGFQYNVTGIGFSDAISIVYTELTGGYLASTSDYNTAYTGTKIIAGTTWGYNSPQYNAVVNAWCAVGIGYNCVTVTQTTPPNDNCNQATWLQSNTSCSWLTNQTVDGATADGFPSTPTCDNFSGTPSMFGVFYKFNAQSATETITVDPTGASTLDAVVVLYSGTTCTNLSQVGCFDQSGGNGLTTILTANNLSIGNTYWIRVYDYGNTPPTDGHFQICVSHQGQSSTCGTPNNLSQSGITQNSANLSWSAVSGSSFYQVSYKNLSTQNTYSQNSSTNSFTLSNLSCGTNYEWSVVAYCNGTPSATSSTSSFQTSSCPPGCNQLTLSAYGNTYTSPATIGDFSVFSNTNCSWTASSNQSFVTITVGSIGAGNGTVGFNIQNNATGSSRTCNITVTASGLTATYVIIQQASTVSFPDLIITNYSVTPNSLPQNYYLLVPYTLSNIGTASASPSRVGVYLSTDCTLSGNDQLLTPAYNLFGTLAAGSDQTMTAGFTVNPASPGSYYVLIVADQNNDNFEGSVGEANNVVCVPLEVTSCGSQASPPNPILSGSGHICANGTTDIIIDNYDHSLRYTWLGGLAGSFDTLNGKFTATGTGLIGCQARNQCGAYSYSNYITVVQDSNPVIYAGNDTTIYSGQSAQLNATANTTVSYSWSPNTYLSNPNINNPVTTPLTAMAYTVIGTTQYGCSGSDNIMVYVIDTTCSSITAPNIIGDTTVCDNLTTQLNAGSGYASYLWSSTATQQIINVGAGNYSVTITDANGCTAASNQITITAKNSPATPTITGITSACNAVTLTANSTACVNCSYEWNNGHVGTTATFNSSGQCNVTVTNTCGTATANSSVTILVTPTATISYTNTSNTYNFSSNAQGSPTAYNWNFGDGNLDNTANPTHTYSITGSITVSLTVTNSCGSNTYQQTININPNCNYSVSQNTVITDSNGTSQPITVTCGSTCLWNVTLGNCTWLSVVPASDTGTSNFTITVPATTDTFMKQCTLTVEGQTISVTQYGKVGSIPCSPVDTSVQVNGGCDLAAATISGASYQWYRNGTPILNATSQYHTANQNGYYHVSIAVGNCTYQSSDHYLTCFTGIEESAISNLKVFPNPTDGTFIINGEAKNATQLSVNLYNTLGQIVYTKDISLKGTTINEEVRVENLSAGIYHLQLLIDKQPYNQKLLVK